MSAKARVNMRLPRLSRLDIGLGLMALASVAIVAIPEERLRTSLELNPSNYGTVIIGDGYVGGTSQAEWISEQSQHWKCKLDPGISEPFCSQQLHISNDEGPGFDLTRFDKMTVWAYYRGSGTHVRFYLRNRHPNYYIPGNSITTKFNTVEVPVKDLPTGLEISMTDFTVAPWWLIGGNVPLEYSRPEFNDVAIVEVQTGSRVNGGTHEFQIHKIVWSGPLIKPGTLYQAVVIVWSFLVACILIHRLILAQRELNRQREAQEELRAINESLNLENRHYEDLAKTDVLTGLRNRVGIRDTLHQGLIDWRDKATPFSFVIIDVDNFKSINDTFGHDAGDRVLKDAAGLMRDHVRRTDTIARWGGEEFVLVCPNTTLDQAVQAAENLRAIFASHLTCGDTKVTASFGVATMNTPSLEDLFKRADTALYKAKNLGRNRVCSDQTSGVSPAAGPSDKAGR